MGWPFHVARLANPKVGLTFDDDHLKSHHGGPMQTSKIHSHSVYTGLDSARTERWEFHYAAGADVGQRRDINEDFFLLHPDRQLYLVADGMGGHAAGEVAAHIAGETIAAYFDEAGVPRRPSSQFEPDESLHQHLVQAIKLANATIVEEASDRPETQGMGTTVTAVTFFGDHAYWAHVGDSRLYRLRGDTLEPMTRDHSLLERTLESQDLSEQEAAHLIEHFPYKNVLTRALGSRYVVDVDVNAAPLQDGDLFVLTTDGVHDVIDDELLAHLLIHHRPHWHQACEAVITEANRAGGPDNITLACIEARAS